MERQDLVGKTIRGRYLLLESIGQRADKWVYVAFDKQIQQRTTVQLEPDQIEALIEEAPHGERERIRERRLPLSPPARAPMPKVVQSERARIQAIVSELKKKTPSSRKSISDLFAAIDAGAAQRADGRRCSACRAPMATESTFCGQCGFRPAPISDDVHQRFAEELGQTDDTKTSENPAVGAAQVSPGLATPAPTPAAALVDFAWDDVLEEAEEQTIAGFSATAVQTEQERRGGGRYPLSLKIDYSSEHNFYLGFVQDISQGGMFVATPEPLAVGAETELRFSLPSFDQQFSAKCVVRWVVAADPVRADIVPGFGAQFVALDAATRAAIELFIAHREPLSVRDP